MKALSKLFRPLQATALALFFFFICNVHAQDNSYTEFTGTVLDANTHKPLTLADISVNGANISTISNADGEFLLKVPNDYLNEALTVSFLGYSKMEFPLEGFKKNTEIYLKPAITKLSEVNIKAPKDGLSLVKATLNRKGKNYTNDQNVMTAFYRETIKKRNRNASLSEAVIEIYKQPYLSGRTDKVKLLKVRKNTNYSKLDTLALKLQGGPFSTLFIDLIKYTDYVFAYENLEDYEFTLDNASNINEHQVFVVNFRQRKHIDRPMYYGKLYIDAETLALVSALYHLNLDDADEASRMFVRKKPNRVKVTPQVATYRVDYRTQNGKWHYRYSNLQLGFKVNWKGKLFNSRYTLSSEMAITDWKQADDQKVSKKELFMPSMILTDEASGFSDPDFWGQYNIIEPEKSIENAIKKINRKLEKA